MLPFTRRETFAVAVAVAFLLLIFGASTASAETVDLGCEDEYVDAPFCSGESMKPCGHNIEVPETEECPPIEEGRPYLCADGLYAGWAERCNPPETAAAPGNAEAADGALGAVPGSCEEDGSCDDSCTPPARGDCTATPDPIDAEPTPAPDPAPAELPATGPDDTTGLLLAALGSIAIGVTLLRKTGLTR